MPVVPPAEHDDVAAPPRSGSLVEQLHTVSADVAVIEPRVRRRFRVVERDGLNPEELAAALVEYRRTGERRIRNRIVEAHMRLVEHYARRYSRSGRANIDDLRQTGLLALIGAVDRFDADGGASLRTFADRTIDGEMKRYLRDRTWIVRPPRTTQETYLDIGRAKEELSHGLRRSPSIGEVATFLGIDEEHVIDGLVAGTARDSDSLSASRDGESPAVPDAVLGALDGSIELTELRMLLREHLPELDVRERDVLRLRFIDDLSQPEIAEAIGLSQSYVSRILRSALSTLRSEFRR